jgi:AmiR/NasT family two-component response regulator
MPAEVDSLLERLEPRKLIGRAVGLLMAREDVSRDTAFELLVQRSSDSRRNVRQAAADIVRQRGGTRS